MTENRGRNSPLARKSEQIKQERVPKALKIVQSYCEDCLRKGTKITTSEVARRVGVSFQNLTHSAWAKDVRELLYAYKQQALIERTESPQSKAQARVTLQWQTPTHDNRIVCMPQPEEWSECMLTGQGNPQYQWQKRRRRPGQPWKHWGYLSYEALQSFIQKYGRFSA